MVIADRRRWRIVAVCASASLVLTACGANPLPSPLSASASATATPRSGGTIYVLTPNEQFDQVDPQRISTPEDLAFFGGTIYRSLEAYTFSPDPKVAAVLTPDLATDTGQRNADATRWMFTLRDGVAWQDGSPITCQDVKYGVSRTFATDVINQGPTYAILYLKIPRDKDGTSLYKGPYSRVGQEHFDKAVTCDGRTITFNLDRPVPDFNDTVTLGFSPVPQRADSAETYGQPGHLAMASGPYEVASYTTGKGSRMVLVRNPHWDAASDPYRKAYPDGWEVDFALDARVIDRRLMASAGKDAMAISYGQIQAEDLPRIFTSPAHPAQAFQGRAVSGFDPWVRYLWVNVAKVPDVNIRRAMWVALDRTAIRQAMGGAFYGTDADGVINPSIGQDYAPTGLLDGSLDWLGGQVIPDFGDPEYAKQLIAKATLKTLQLTYFYDATVPLQRRIADIVKSSLGRAGFDVTPIPYGNYYSPALTDPSRYDMGIGGWGADWPSASTVMPAMFTKAGGWDLSQLDDANVNAEIDAARAEVDRGTQAADWQAINRQIMENMYVLPTFFTTSQSVAGAKVGSVYRWPPYSSWPYGAMFVTD